MTANPLLDPATLPRFNTIAASDIEPAVSSVLSDNRRQLKAILAVQQDGQPTWETLMSPLDELEDRLSKVWSTVSHLNAVKNTPQIRAAYEKCQPLITEYYTEMGQNRELFEAIGRLEARADELGLDQSQRKILRDYLLEFRLAGVDLPAEKKARFAELESTLSSLSNRFSNNVLDATMNWSRLVSDEAQLAGVPESTRQAAAEAAQRKGLQGWLLTLDFPCYMGVMTNADNRELRQELYTAYVTRASDQGPHDPSLDNQELITQILSCRAELAQLLGYRHYADVSTARKMAGSAERVNAFLQELTELAVPAAREEYQRLRGFANEVCGIADLQAWDILYCSEKLRQQSFAISQEELRPYFPLPQVREGLFEVASRLYGITITPDTDMETWDESVSGWSIHRDGDLLARFYLDLFTREGKRGGAWMAECRSRRVLADGSVQTPVAYLVCNFAAGTGGNPPRLTHNEVTTLFHEFGHGLHHMLTRERHLRSSGINGVAWDAVELPSQLMENWCWDPEAIALISSHYESGETLPEALLGKLLAARNFQAAMATVRQLEFAQIDFRFHQLAGNVDASHVMELVRSVQALTSVYPVPEFNRFQNSFSHIFAGGYAAGYYSYKWAEVLSADVFSAFAANGVFDAETGNRFLERILSRGGGADPLDLFKDFMGREPQIEALLIQDGLLRPEAA